MRFRFLALLALILFCSVASAETLVVKVSDMSCENCASAIEARVKQEAGVVSVTTDVDSKTVTIVTGENTKLSDERVKELVKDSGFTASQISREKL